MMETQARAQDFLVCADAYPTLNPPLIQQYLNASGIIMGKTNLAEMQATLTSINPHTNGITSPLNAYDPTRIAGGKVLYPI